MDMEQSSENKKEDNFLLTGYEDASSYSQDALRSILLATRASNEIPSAGDEFDYYSTFQGFRALMLKEGKSILSLMASLIQTQGIREKFEGRELEDKFDLLIDVNDTIFENVSNHLDEAMGLKKSEEEIVIATKRATDINTSWNRKFNTQRNPQNYTLLAAKNITRPQLLFLDKVDNSNTAFVPLLKEKPNSIKPLAIILEKDNGNEAFCHPYECEIEKFSIQEHHLQAVEPSVPKSTEETPLIFIKTKDQLLELHKELSKKREFAVDLEHHSYRSFQGFSCIMQISTREKDYIIDCLDLRSEMNVLNEVFTDPKIVKVLHGADMDVLWLQRDFGIYIVNLFDTGQAARVLHFAHLSLSYLLKHFCKIDVDKKFQLADWRMRPLPAEMIKYAREDTHYLLYVYDCLKNELLKNGNEIKNLLHSCFERSKIICLKKYEKPLFNEEKYLELCKKSQKILNARQLYCLKELYSWRDRIARENDESLGYVLPNHMLLQIAEALPREQQGILACCNPIPPFVRQQLNELHSIIYRANELSLKQLEAPEFQHKAKSQPVNNQIDLNSMLHCPHDILHLEERRVQTLSQSNFKENYYPKTRENISSLKKKPSMTALVEKAYKKTKSKQTSTDSSFIRVTEIIKTLISPFQRYKFTKEFNAGNQESTTEVQANTEKVCITNNPAQSGEKYTNVNKSVQVIDEGKTITTNVSSRRNPKQSEAISTLNASCEIIESTSLGEKVSNRMDPKQSAAISTLNTSCEIIESTPLRKKISSRRNLKQNEAISTLSTSCEIIESTPLGKKVFSRRNPKQSEAISTLNTSSEIIESTPLRRKLNKRRKKRKCNEPDVPLDVTQETCEQPSNKKVCTPEVIEVEKSDFQPYDYSQADLSVFKGKKKSKEGFMPSRSQKFQTPGKARRKHVKQATFGKESKTWSNTKNWPQNK